MDKTEKNVPVEKLPITSPESMDEAIREVEQKEQLYSIALFDILRFSNFVEKNGTLDSVCTSQAKTAAQIAMQRT